MGGSKWDPVNGLTGSGNAFNNLGSSTARYGCCPASKYMSSPEVNPFVEANSCSPCPAGTHVSLATSILNDETSCMLLGVYDKMPDGCLGKDSSDRSCDPRKAVDDTDATYNDAFTTITTGLTGDYKYNAGIAVGTKIYALPYNQNDIGVIDTANNDAFTTIATGLTGSNKYYSGVAVGTKVYALPFFQDDISVITTGTRAHPKYGPIENWDLAVVTDISYLFQHKGTMNADLSSWDVSRVTNMQGST